MRIRSIKPEFHASHDIAALPEPTALHFVGLWNYAQDNGVGRDDARLLKAALYPLRDAVTPAVIEERMVELAVAGLIVRYRDKGVPVFHIPTWETHQVINRRSACKHAQPSEDTETYITDPSVSHTGGLPSGREGRGGEQGAGSVEQGAGNRELITPRAKRADRTAKADGNGKLRGGYPARLAEVWAASMGELAPARFGVCKPVVEKYGLDLVMKALDGYCRTAMQEGKAQFASPILFTKTAREWILRATPFSRMTREEAASIGVLQDWVNVGGGSDLEGEAA